MTRSLPILLPCSILLGAAVVNAAHGRGAFQSDGFVRMLERHVGIEAGETKVLPECSCSVRYLGTKIDGKLYTVVIEKMD